MNVNDEVVGGGRGGSAPPAAHASNHHQVSWVEERRNAFPSTFVIQFSTGVLSSF